MQCTPKEIEEKRRQALAKLLAKKHGSSSPLKTLNQQNYDSEGSLVENQETKRFFINRSPGAYRFNQAANGVSPLKQSNIKPYDKQKPVIPFQNAVISGVCSLISEDRFCVELSGFSSQAVEVFKTIPSKCYNSMTKNWSFHICDYELLQQKLQSLHPDVVVGKIPKFVFNVVRLPKSDYTSIDLSKIDPELVSALMPFQEEGVCYGIDKNGRCLIADDMGLGKTFQALGIANYYKEDWPLLIATTASMKNTWESTIHEYLPSVSVMHTQYMVSSRDYIGDSRILIVSHDMMSRSIKQLLEKNFGVIIIDESHTFKNFKAKCTKAAIDLSKKAKRVILLSGTPALSRPSELYSQLSLIDDKFFGGFYEYSKRYCDGKNSTFGWDATGTSNLPELEIILAKKFMIRRTKEDVLKSLPNKTQEIVTLDVNLAQFSEEDRRCLNALAAKYVNSKKNTDKHAALLTFFAETAKIKIPSVCSYILQILDRANKFLVFAHHQKMLDAIEKVLKKKNKLYIRIDGNTTGDRRKYFIDKFQFDDKYVCAILSITAANAGITLTAAQLVLFAELHWNPSILSQAESRAHRIGQEGRVIIKYLLAPGTADDSMWPLLQSKQKILNEIGLSKDSFNDVSITKQDLTDTEPIADCLQTSLTSVNTFDISTYFKTPEKNKQLNKSEQSVDSSLNSEHMMLLDDDFDDVVGNIDFNF